MPIICMGDGIEEEYRIMKELERHQKEYERYEKEMDKLMKIATGSSPLGILKEMRKLDDSEK